MRIDIRIKSWFEWSNDRNVASHLSTASPTALYRATFYTADYTRLYLPTFVQHTKTTMANPSSHCTYELWNLSRVDIPPGLSVYAIRAPAT
jgi:hypothetical protein